MGEVDGVDTNDGHQPPWFHLTFYFDVKADDGTETRRAGRLRFNLIDAWTIADAIHRLGDIDHAVALGEFAFAAAKMNPFGESPLPSEFERAMMRKAIRTLAGSISQRWKSTEDRLLDFNYHLLQENSISRASAAKLASHVLGRQYETDAYRLKLDRWAEKNKLTKVRMKTGRKPRELKPEHK